MSNFEPPPPPLESSSAFTPTHLIPPEGMSTWSEPDGAKPAGSRAGGGLEVALVTRNGAWAQVKFSNGWTAWVDGRRLVDRTPAPPPQTRIYAQPPAAPAAPVAPVPPAAAAVPSPPQGAWSPPASAQPPAAWPSPPPPGPGGGYAPSPASVPVVGLIGAGLTLIGTFLPWVRGASGSALHEPVGFLWGGDQVSAIKVGYLMIAFAVIGAAVAALRASPAVVRVMGILSALLVLGTLGQFVRIYRGNAFTNVLSFGIIVSFVGAIMMIAGAGKKRV